MLLVDAGRIVGLWQRVRLRADCGGAHRFDDDAFKALEHDVFVELLARTKAAYAALGGTEDEATAIKSELLTAITTDFLGADAASSAIAGVVKHKMKAVAEVLAMGGELDSDEEAELKDTTKLEFDEVRAYLESVAGLAGSAAESAEVLR